MKLQSATGIPGVAAALPSSPSISAPAIQLAPQNILPAQSAPVSAQVGELDSIRSSMVLLNRQIDQHAENPLAAQDIAAIRAELASLQARFTRLAASAKQAMTPPPAPAGSLLALHRAESDPAKRCDLAARIIAERDAPPVGAATSQTALLAQYRQETDPEKRSALAQRYIRTRDAA